jgi:hypothetical protein
MLWSISIYLINIALKGSERSLLNSACPATLFAYPEIGPLFNPDAVLAQDDPVRTQCEGRVTNFLTPVAA